MFESRNLAFRYPATSEITSVLGELCSLGIQRLISPQIIVPINAATVLTRFEARHHAPFTGAPGGYELVVSWTVWSHHLLSDQAQPELLKMGSGELVTAFELITQGLAFFITLATLYRARPLAMTNELKFLIGGLLGFALAVPAGIMQADVGLNRVLHNTQWVVGPHVHVAILVGLTMTLYSAVYFLLPILTNGAKLWSQKLATLHFWCHLVGGVGMGAFMGMAGLQGMLRRTIYVNFEYGPYMVLAALSGALLLVALAAFLLNIVMTLGLKGALGIFRKGDLPETQLLPTA